VTPASISRTPQPSTQQACQCRILDRNDDLSAGSANSGEHLDKIEGTVVVDVLNGIVQQ
jgi:hypothetical protein